VRFAYNFEKAKVIISFQLLFSSAKAELYKLEKLRYCEGELFFNT